MSTVTFTTTTATWPDDDDTWSIDTNQHVFVDLHFYRQETTGNLVLVVYQASDCGTRTNVTDPETWRVFDLVERTSR